MQANVIFHSLQSLKGLKREDPRNIELRYSKATYQSYQMVCIERGTNKALTNTTSKYFLSLSFNMSRLREKSQMPRNDCTSFHSTV